MRTIWLSGPAWLAVLRIGLGLWWLESWRHKDRKVRGSANRKKAVVKVARAHARRE